MSDEDRQSPTLTSLITHHSLLITPSMPDRLDGPLRGQEGEEIAAGAEAGDLADDHRADQRVVAELLAAEDVTQVYFNRRQAHGGDGVAEGHARVGVRRRIDDDRLSPVERRVDRLHEFPLVV